MEEVQKKEKFHHPKGLWLACIGMAGSSYLKYAVSGITIFFYTYSVAMGGLGLSDKQAGLIISIAGAFGSVLPLLGSIVTDRFLGMQKAMIMAFFLQSVAYAIFFFFTPHVPMIIVGIVINMCSMAFMNNNLTAIVGMLYSNKEHARKDAAYGIFYMAVNIGSFFGPIFGGLLTDHWMAVKDAEGNIVRYGYKYAYLMVAIGMFIVFLIFLVLIPKWLGEVGKHPANAKGANKEEKQKVEFKFSPVEKTRLVGMGIIFILVTVYWTVYFQTSYTINTLANDYVNLNVGGFHVPVVWLISFNGILCIILAPLLGNLWMTLSQKKLDPPVSLKMAVGMIISINQKRWQIEECFRIMKSEFQARPVYLSRKDRITAHFITCFTALILYRILEKKLGESYTTESIIRTLKEMNMLIAPGEGYIPEYTRTDLTDKLHDTFGFRTDYEIVSQREIKKILTATRK